MYENIKEIDGDVLNCDANVIVHCCNTLNIFGAGIAKKIKEVYPEAWEADCKSAKDGTNVLGNFSYARTKDGKIIVNLYGQDTIGQPLRNVDYEALADGLERIRRTCDATHRIKPIILGFPYKMGANLAGGNWRIIKTIIEEYFKDAKYPILIVKLP